MNRETPAAGSPEGWRRQTSGGVVRRYAVSNRDRCSVCGREFALRGDGKVRAHKRLDSHLACSGSNLEPNHIHLCACGACWDEEVYA